MEAQDAATGAMPTVPVTVEEVLTRVNPRLERFENAFAQSAIAEPKVQELHPKAMKVRSR